MRKKIIQLFRRVRASRRAQFGGSVEIQEGVLFRGDRISIGTNATIYRRCELHGPLAIGANCFFNFDVVLRAGCVIGNGVSIGPRSMLITDHHHLGPPDRRAGTNERKIITVGDGVWIGAGVVILPGVTIGAGSIVAAGAVVTRDVTPHTLVAGVPARHLRAITVVNP